MKAVDEINLAEIAAQLKIAESELTGRLVTLGLSQIASVAEHIERTDYFDSYQVDKLLGRDIDNLYLVAACKKALPKQETTRA